MTRRSLLAALLLAGAAAACDDDPTGTVPPVPIDPATAPRASVDRFSPAASTIFDRTAIPGLPAAGAAIDMDQGPFITHGLGPAGQQVSYYNFDVQPDDPAPFYVFLYEGTTTAVPNQLPVIDLLPGEAGYSDFRRIIRVYVPAGYVANTVTSLPGINNPAFRLEPTDIVVNYPVVPEGSTADLGVGGNATPLRQGWYKSQAFFYFAFEEALLRAPLPNGKVPVAPIYVSFTINPGQPGGGPASGFLTEPGTDQTHNVVSALPADATYSPLWDVIAYDRADFAAVFDLGSAVVATLLGSQGLVNCPVVRVQ
ncbi:MAG TPA: hypothetical protein VFN96_07625 [Gemmatimonadales bacterium]|nr:hypothetical protein [Gemmatimonadales bacterium]